MIYIKIVLICSKFKKNRWRNYFYQQNLLTDTEHFQFWIISTQYRTILVKACIM